MARFNASNITTILSDPNIDKSTKASTSATLITEIDNVLKDFKQILVNRSITESCKYTLWQGLLNNYGIFGYKRYNPRLIRGSSCYYTARYKKGDLLSIDFGTSNMDYEFSYTHTGIVIADYEGFIVVIPITSFQEGKTDSWPQEIKDLSIPIYHEDYPVIKDDSYILFHQIRSVSKNRITREIGNINGTKIMEDIESVLITQYFPELSEKMSE